MNRLLLIDDNTDFRLIFQRKFSEWGYQVYVAGDGVRGLQVVMEHAVDLILLDWNMPHRNGRETLKLIRSVNAHVPVLIVTALMDDTDEQDARRLGVADILYKPLGIKALHTVARSILDSAPVTHE